MTDDLDRLRAALQATPAPDSTARDQAMAQAMAAFDRLQGLAKPMRPMKAPPLRRAFHGVRTLLMSLTSRPALAATTSVAALCLGVVVSLPVLRGDLPVPAPQTLDAPRGPDLSAPVATTPVADLSPADSVVTQQPATDAVAPVRKAAPAGPAPAQQEVPQAEGRSQRGIVQPNASFSTAPAQDLLTEQALSDAGLSADAARPLAGDDQFANAPANPVQITAEAPVSTFSVDVDTASYAWVRSSLNQGFLPDPASVRVEEMINALPYDYPAPSDDTPFAASISVMPTPWNAGTRLVQIGLQGRLPATTDRPALNLVLLVDTSGSMDDPLKLPLLKQSLLLMLPQLRDGDQIAIVAYAGSAGVVLPPTSATDRAAIRAALDQMVAGGGTAGEGGLALAYDTASGMAAEGEVSRILLATDGDFNIGISDPAALQTYVAAKRDSGTYLSVLGFGRGNLDDATMQALAQNGNGTAAYVDSLAEARRRLVDQFTGTLFPIADDVKIQVEWNPAEVAEYRLIGYETRALSRADFGNDRVDAGEIGAGHQVTALYEVTAPDSPALQHDPLRYGTAKATPTRTGELGYLRLRAKAPGAEASTLTETPIPAEGATDGPGFAVAMAGFGQLLRASPYIGDWGWDQAIALADQTRGPDPFGQRAEAITLMRLARDLAGLAAP